MMTDLETIRYLAKVLLDALDEAITKQQTPQDATECHTWKVRFDSPNIPVKITHGKAKRVAKTTASTEISRAKPKAKKRKRRATRP